VNRHYSLSGQLIPQITLKNMFTLVKQLHVARIQRELRTTGNYRLCKMCPIASTQIGHSPPVLPLPQWTGMAHPPLLHPHPQILCRRLHFHRQKMANMSHNMHFVQLSVNLHSSAKSQYS